MGAMGLDQRLYELTATEIVKAIQAGQTSCEAVAQACLRSCFKNLRTYKNNDLGHHMQSI